MVQGSTSHHEKTKELLSTCAPKNTSSQKWNPELNPALQNKANHAPSSTYFELAQQSTPLY
jgi:hypothetical protein